MSNDSMQNQDANQSYEFPIAPVQAAFVFMNQIYPNSLAYNIPVCVRLEGELDKQALHNALNYLVQRHEILRTTYGLSGDALVQKVQPFAPCSVDKVDLTGVPEAAPDEKLNEWFQTRKHKTFDLGKGPVLFAELAELSKYDHCLLITIHHVAVDHGAVGLFARELGQLYQRFSQGIEPDLPEQELQYADYVMWVKETNSQDALAEKTAVWQNRLSEFSGYLNLPLDKARPKISSTNGAQYLFSFDEDRSALVKRFAGEQSVSVYLTILSALKVLLARKSRQKDIIVGTPFANRGDQEELQNVMGCFLNTLPLATDLSTVKNYVELIAAVKTIMLEAYDYQSLPFETIVNAVNPNRDHSYNPIFQVGFVFQEPPTDIKLPGVKCTTVPAHSGGAMYDLHWWMWEDGNHLAGLVWYNTDIYQEATVKKFVDELGVTLNGLMENPQSELVLA